MFAELQIISTRENDPWDMHTARLGLGIPLPQIRIKACKFMVRVSHETEFKDLLWADSGLRCCTAFAVRKDGSMKGAAGRDCCCSGNPLKLLDRSMPWVCKLPREISGKLKAYL